MTIQKIHAADTIDMRQQILRPGHTRESCQFPEDNDALSAHFGAYVDDDLVGIVSVFNVPLADSPYPQQNACWQIRAMATTEKVRGKGYARELLGTLEDYVKSKGGYLIWCNARSGALGFYQKQDYHILGDEFDIQGVGLHYKMVKVVKP